MAVHYQKEGPSSHHTAKNLVTASQEISNAGDEYALQALLRDDYRCMVTGRTEGEYQEFPSQRGSRTELAVTQAAHIIPGALNRGTNSDEIQVSMLVDPILCLLLTF